MRQGGAKYHGIFYANRKEVVINDLPGVQIVTGTVANDCNRISWNYGRKNGFWVWQRTS